MLDIPPDRRDALELRYDGPIPAQHLVTDQTRRQRRGTLAVLESQVFQFLDAAGRCQDEMEDLAADMMETSFAGWQRHITERRLRDSRDLCEAHIRAAVGAMKQAVPLRRDLGLGAHPIAAFAGLLMDGDRPSGE